MKAETAINVFDALPENEAQRFDAMYNRRKKTPIASNKRPDPVWSLEKFIEVLTHQLNEKKRKRIVSQNTNSK